MKKLFIALATVAFSMNLSAKTDNCPADMVNPLMGTESTFAISTGNTYPAIALPWGMNFWMPQTGKMGDGWAYVYTENKIRDFKQTHQPSPWINDYGQFALMPETGTPEFHQDKRASWFSHRAEESRPYFYKVYLADYDVTTEIAPTERAAIMRVTYPETDKASFIIDALDRGSYVKIIPEKRMVIGYTTKNSGGVPENFKNYFVLKFDHPFAVSSTVEATATGADRNKDPYGDIKTSKNLELQANHAGAIIEFAPMKRGEQVNVRIASSFISFEQAEANLDELGGRSFDAVKADAKAIWNKTLGAIEVEDDDIDNIRTFYSCLYRAVLFPRMFWEVANGKPVHYSPYNGEVAPGYMYTDAGFWDVFRCLFPLLNLVYPDTNEKIQNGLANTYRESGFLPEWMSPGHRGCMVGNNSASIVADAILLGLNISDEDKQTLWEAVVHGANAVHPTVSSTGRLGWEYYNKLGYVPYDVKINENVAR
ncbi:MAG: GH92 family glycosyl hydrolase, partial [Prevotellaceae bacterium]|nr:GH92 family glycosyl hydrolase [Prevotellaceae bacterium]